jgi:hypothetical protein
MIEHIEYFKTTDGNEFKSAEEALTHELKTNKDVMKFKLVGYDKYDDEPYWEIPKDKNLKALAKDIWYEADYVYIENKDAFNFVAMLAYLTDDEIDAYYFNSNSFKGVGWYEIGTNHQLNYMKDIITSWYETMSKYSTCPPTEYNIILLDYYKKKITNLENMMKNLNRFI